MLKNILAVFPRHLCHVFLIAVISSTVVFLYHHYCLRPHDLVVVDFRMLSEAKLSQMVEESRNGHPASAEAIKSFINRLHQTIVDEAHGRPVYLAGAVFNPHTDLTSRVASRLSIDLSQAYSKTLPALAERVDRSFQRQPSSSSPTPSHPAQGE